MPERLINTFFYGLFMDEEVLRAAKVEPREPRRAVVPGYRLLIGNRATLSPAFGAQSYGVLFNVAPEELRALYSAPGLESYKPQSVLAMLENGSFEPATTYNLATDPLPNERNPEYAGKLRAVLARLAFPKSHIESVA